MSQILSPVTMEVRAVGMIEAAEAMKLQGEALTLAAQEMITAARSAAGVRSAAVSLHTSLSFEAFRFKITLGNMCMDRGSDGRSHMMVNASSTGGSGVCRVS